MSTLTLVTQSKNLILNSRNSSMISELETNAVDRQSHITLRSKGHKIIVRWVPWPDYTLIANLTEGDETVSDQIEALISVKRPMTLY